MKLFLDLDGVLVNWTKGAHELHGIRWHKRWSYARGPAGWDWAKEVGISNTKLFKDMGYDFWKNLDWTDDGKEILDLVENLVDPTNVFLLTSPCRTRGCVDGRRTWIDREMPRYSGRTLIACSNDGENPKSAVARPDAILVDDYDVNIDSWIENDGLPILCPRPWNKLEHLSGSPIQVIERSISLYLERIANESARNR